MQLAGQLLGPHIIGGVDRTLGGDYMPDLLARWQPRLIVILDPNANDIRKLRAVCPRALIVQRIYIPDGHMAARISENPLKAADYTHGLLMERAHLSDEMMFGQVENEVCEKVYTDLPKLDQYGRHCVQLGDRDDIKRCLFNFSVGWPDLPEDDRLAWWRKFYPSMRAARDGGHLIGVHQYGGNSIYSPDGGAWTAARLENQILPILPAEFDSLKFAITEFGVSRVEGAPKGWRQSYGMDHTRYVGDMQQHMRWVRSEGYDRRIAGYAVFTWGRLSDDWAPNDVEGDCARAIADSGAELPAVEFDEWLGAGDAKPPAETVLYQASVTASQLNFRTGPDTGHAVIRKLNRGEIVEVIEETTINWAKVRESGGVVGYAFRAYLVRVDASPIDPPVDPPDGNLLARVNALEAELAETRTAVALHTVDIAHLKTRVAALESSTPDPPPDVTRQLSPAIAHLNMGIATPGAKPVRYRVKRAFTTHNGAWEPDAGDIYAVPQWARDAYLKPFGAPDYHDSAGGDHHIFARVEDAEGNFIAGERIRFAWPAGHDSRVTSDRHGWCNIPITSHFVPERGERGAWDVLVDDSGSESIGRFSLPAKQHVSLFVVFEEVAS